MIDKYAIAGVAGTALLASVAFAQSPTSPGESKMAPPAKSDTMAPPAKSDAATTSASTSSFQGNWRASKLVGLNVYNEKNESVGSINDMLTDKNGKIVAVVIGVGGFLGVGEHLVAVPFEKVKFSDKPVASASAPAKPGATTTTGSASNTAATTAAKTNPWYPDHAVFNATKDELKAMPAVKYST